jgi:hypothetical protein
MGRSLSMLASIMCLQGVAMVTARAADAADTGPTAAPPSTAPQMTPPPPPPPGPVPTKAPEMAPPPAPPQAGVPVDAPVMAPPPPPPPPPPTPEPAKIGYSFGVRVGMRLQDPDKPKTMSELHLDNSYDGPALEARFHGAVTDQFSWVVNFNGVVNGGTTAPAGSVGLEDVIGQFKACKEFQIWAGRLLVPSDRSNFAGPFFMIPWNYPGFYLAGAAPIGPMEGANGRNNGATLWGNAIDDKLKYYVGVYGIDGLTKDAQAFYSGRVSYSLQGSEPGYFGSSTYYGALNVVTVGFGAQWQKDGANDTTTGAPKDFYSVMADIFAEENVTDVGTFTFEGQYYNFPKGYSFSGPGAPFSPQNAFYVLGAYMTPNNLGIGKLQPMVRLQQTADPAWTVFDAALAYVIKDYSARIVATYQHTELGSSPLPGLFAPAAGGGAALGMEPAPGPSNSIQLAVQLQTL